MTAQETNQLVGVIDGKVYYPVAWGVNYDPPGGPVGRFDPWKPAKKKDAR